MAFGHVSIVVVFVELVERDAVVKMNSLMVKSADIVAFPLESKRKFTGWVIWIL